MSLQIMLPAFSIHDMMMESTSSNADKNKYMYIIYRSSQKYLTMSSNIKRRLPFKIYNFQKNGIYLLSFHKKNYILLTSFSKTIKAFII